MKLLLFAAVSTFSVLLSVDSSKAQSCEASSFINYCNNFDASGCAVGTNVSTVLENPGALRIGCFIDYSSCIQATPPNGQMCK